MKELTAIKRLNNVNNDPFSGYDDSQIEDKNKLNPKFRNKNIIEQVFSEYDRYKSNFVYTAYKHNRYITDLILSPAEISLFTELILDRDKQVYNISYKRGHFLTNLIQNSYNHGYRKFNFDFDNQRFENFLFHFHGKAKDPLLLTVDGPSGEDWLRASSNINCTINGDVGINFALNSVNINSIINGSTGSDFGSGSANLIAEIKGDVGYRFGHDSYHLTTLIHGNVQSMFGTKAKNLSARIHGDLNFDLGSFNGMGNSSIYFSQKNTIKKVSIKLYELGRRRTVITYFFDKILGIYGNSLYHIDENGKEKLVTKFIE